MQRTPPPYNSYERDVEGKWEGYLTASESLRWLRDNGCEVQKNSDGIGYTITRDTYDHIRGGRNSLHVEGDVDGPDSSGKCSFDAGCKRRFTGKGFYC